MFFRRLFDDPPYARAVRWAWIVVLLAICVRVGVAPHKQSSYAADYAPAGWHWLHGAEAYNRQRHFVYSPPVAAFFAPFSALPDAVGGILWRLLGAWALLEAAAASLARPSASPGTRSHDARSLPTAFLLLLPLALGNINLGQMNVLILALVTGGVLAVRRQSWNLAAVLLAVAAFIKIYPLAIGLLLVLLYPRQLSWRLALAMAGLFVGSFGLGRPGYVWTEYHHWFAALGADNRLDADLYSSWRDFGFLLRAAGVPLSNHAYRIMEVAAGGALAGFLWFGQRRAWWPRETLLDAVFCLGCAWMVLFGPATEAATYVVLSLPVCGTLVAAWFPPPDARREKSVPAVRALLTTAYVLLLLADVTNGWFRKETNHLYMRALQPVAALLFTEGVVRSLLRRLPDAPGGSMVSHANADGENGGGGRRID